MVYPSLLVLEMVLLAAPLEPSRSFSQVEPFDDEPVARVFVDAGQLDAIHGLDLDGSESVEPDEVANATGSLSRYFERSFVLKRGYRPCEPYVGSVELVGSFVRAEMAFQCASDGFLMVEARFANAIPDPHRHEMELTRRDGSQQSYSLSAPYRRQFGKSSLLLAIWIYLSAGVRGVFAGPPVLAFFVLASLTGLVGMPNRDVRFPMMTAGFVVAAVLRPFYWPDAAPAPDLLALFPVAALAFYWLGEPDRAAKLAPWLAPWLGAAAGAQWLRYGWPGDFGFIAWFALLMGALGCWVVVAFACALLADGAVDRRRSHQRTFIIGVLGVVLIVAHALAGGVYVSLLLVPYIFTAIQSVSGRVRTSSLARRSVVVFVLSVVIVLLVGPR